MGHRRDLQTGVLFKRGLGVSERSELTPCNYYNKKNDDIVYLHLLGSVPQIIHPKLSLFS